MIPPVGKPRETLREERSSPAPAGRDRILVADEAETVRRSLLDILRKCGTSEDQIKVATSPGEALAAFHEHEPSIVFTEFLGVHPEDGLEIIHEILERSPTTRVVLVTAEPPEGPEVRAAIRAGVFAVVPKPLRHEKIRQVLSDLESEIGGIERMR